MPKHILLGTVIAVVAGSALAQSTGSQITDWSRDWKVGSPDSVYATRTGNLVRIGNRFLERVYRITHDTAATSQRINKVSKAPADVTIFSTDHEWTYDVNKSFSKSRNSPFDGKTFKGGPVATVAAGEFVWRG